MMHPIKVIPRKNAADELEWTVTYGLKSGSKPSDYPVVELDHGGTNERFKITLVDPTYGIKFSDDPLWIQKGSCPTTSGIDTSLIDKFEPGETVIRFRDLNSNVGEVSLWYRLNFTVPGLNPGDPGTFLDPEIRNGGGGGPGINKLLAYATLAAAVVAAGYVAYEAFFDK